MDHSAHLGSGLGQNHLDSAREPGFSKLGLLDSRLGFVHLGLSLLLARLSGLSLACNEAFGSTRFALARGSALQFGTRFNLPGDRK